MRAVVTSLIVWAFLLGCASPSPDLDDLVLDQWIEVKSDEFTLTGDASLEEMEKIAKDLSIYLAVVDLLTNHATARVPAHFYIVSDVGCVCKLFDDHKY